MVTVALLQVLHTCEDRVLDLPLLLRDFLVQLRIQALQGRDVILFALGPSCRVREIYGALLPWVRGATHNRFLVCRFP